MNSQRTIRTILRGTIVGALALLPAAASAQQGTHGPQGHIKTSTPPEDAPIRPIDRTCLPAGTSAKIPVPLFREDLAIRYGEIAVIDSCMSDCRNESDVRAQLADIQQKARLAGADAVIRVRQLTNKRWGFINNPNTPFDSVMQGAADRYFFRGTAIKYQQQVRGEPKTRTITAGGVSSVTSGGPSAQPTGNGLSGFSPLSMGPPGTAEGAAANR